MKASVLRHIIIREMPTIDSLYQQFDPARPLEANEVELYVDWQQEIGTTNVKKLLVHSIARTGGVPVTRLFTGHRGVGKTTELKRVQEMLEHISGSRRLFVSLLQAEQWIDLQDVQPPDIVFHIVRQLIADLDRVGCGYDKRRFLELFREIWDQLNREVELKDLKFKTENAELGLVLKDVPVARARLRMLLQTRLPTIFHLINDIVLRDAKTWLAKHENGSYADILIIVDELDRIPQKVLNDRGLTNHENIFLDHAGILRSLNCDVLYTIPIELAYSRCRQRLRDVYGSDILSLPVIPVISRTGSPFEAGIKAISEIIERRATRAGVSLKGVFDRPEIVTRLANLSGGHVRNLFILIRSALDYCDNLPLTDAIIDMTVRQESDSIALPLGAREWKLLKEVHKAKKSLEDAGEIWYGLLRDLYVFAYRDSEGIWYDWNPLLQYAS